MVEFKNDPKAKRYFWLKLKTDFFDQKEIKLLRRLAGGDTYTIIYLKMLLMFEERDNKLLVDKSAKDIALELNEKIDNVIATLNFFESKNLLNVAKE